MTPVVATPPPTLAPVATTQAPTSAGAGWGTYVVKSGDSLYTIAQRHHTTVSALVARNKLPNGGRLIRPGQQLQVPGSATAPKSTAKPAATSSPAKNTPALNTTTTYTVRAGDTLIGIAQRHKTTAQAIAQLNRISVSGIIRVGQKLRVPTDGKAAAKAASTTPAAPKTPAATAAPTTTTYTVRAGDTLIGIAQRHKTTARAIAQLNRINVSGIIRVGQKLRVPSAAKPAATAAPATAKPAAKPAAAPTTTTYTVRAGDTLIGIAQRHKTTARAIAQLNKISVSGTIRVGQKLRVPTDGKAAAKAASSSKPAPKPVPQPEMSTKFNSGGYSASHFPTTTVAAARKNHELLASMPVPTRDQTKDLIVATAKKHGVDPALALAIAHQESGFNQRQVSVANAIGIMQVIPSSGDWAGQMVGRKLNLLDAEDNVTAGVAILRSLLRSTKNEEMALAGYYQGLASVRKNGMYSDTRAYIRNIQALRDKYQ